MSDVLSLLLSFPPRVIALCRQQSIYFQWSAWAWIIKKLPSYIQIDTLRRFNKKFRPRWVPRYAIYRSAIDIASIGIAALNAEAMLPFQKRDEIPMDVQPAEIG